MNIRQITPDDWQTLRDTRLAALRDAPDAFGSAYAETALRTEEWWRERATCGGNGVMFFADVPGWSEPAGLAGGYEEEAAADLISMWVRPTARGQKVGEALIEATAGWARSRGHDTLFLWVTESNDPARRLYERCGFTPTGETQPLPSNPALAEIRMRRGLG